MKPACAASQRNQGGKLSSSCSSDTPARQAVPALPARSDQPDCGYLGSSNLTFSGLRHQGELNIDVLDHEPVRNLASGLKTAGTTAGPYISKELVEIIESSWARSSRSRPYHIYLRLPITCRKKRGLD